MTLFSRQLHWNTKYFFIANGVLLLFALLGLHVINDAGFYLVIWEFVITKVFVWYAVIVFLWWIVVSTFLIDYARSHHILSIMPRAVTVLVWGGTAAIAWFVFLGLLRLFVIYSLVYVI